MLAILVGLWASLLLARGTPAGALLHRWLVEAPAHRLSKITRGHLLFAGLTLAIIVSVIWVLQSDGRMILSMGLPEFFSFAAAVDLSAILDLAVVAVIAATTLRVGAIRTWLVQRIAPRRPRARRPRAQRTRKPANDDEDRRAVALAA